MASSASWSGKLCARCGVARTSNLSGGEPICTPCLHERRAQAAAEGQPPRKCPIDASILKPAYVDGIVIDRCPACSGVFLEKGELEVLVRAAKSAGAAWSQGVIINWF